MDLSTVSEVYIGSTKAKAIYFGSNLIWESDPQQTSL